MISATDHALKIETHGSKNFLKGATTKTSTFHVFWNLKLKHVSLNQDFLFVFVLISHLVLQLNTNWEGFFRITEVNFTPVDEKNEGVMEALSKILIKIVKVWIFYQLLI